MKQSTKIVAAAMGGYVLGRQRKFKLAIALGLYAAGKQLKLNPQKIAELVISRIGDSPQLAELREQAQGELATVGKAAASAIIDRQAGHLADALQSRTARLSGETAEEDETEDEGDVEDNDQAEDTAEDEEAAEDEDAGGSGSRSGGGTKRRAQARRSGSGTSRRRRTTAGSES